MSKKLGKIQSVRFGFGGYQDGQFGLSLTLGGKSWGVQTFIGGAWCLSIKVTEYTKWTEQDRDSEYAEMCRKIDKLMSDAKVDDVAKLKNIPIEAEFDDSRTLKDWRILTEVI